MTTPVKEIVRMSDFDFSTSFARQQRRSSDLYDGICILRNKGRTRTTTTTEINLTNFVRNGGVVQKSLAIGTNKFKRGGRVIFVFDNDQLSQTNAKATINKQGACNVYSMGHVKKLFEEFGIEAPTKPDTACSMYFKLAPVEGQPKIYVVVPVQVTTYDAAGQPTTQTLKS